MSENELPKKKQVTPSLDQQMSELLQKNNKKLVAQITFPQYRILPDELQLAVKVISNHKAQYLISLVDSSTD